MIFADQEYIHRGSHAFIRAGCRTGQTGCPQFFHTAGTELWWQKTGRKLHSECVIFPVQVSLRRAVRTLCGFRPHRVESASSRRRRLALRPPRLGTAARLVHVPAVSVSILWGWWALQSQPSAKELSGASGSKVEFAHCVHPGYPEFGPTTFEGRDVSLWPRTQHNGIIFVSESATELNRSEWVWRS